MVDVDPLTGACKKCYMFEFSYKVGRDPTKPTVTKSFSSPEEMAKKVKQVRSWGDDKHLIFFGSMTDVFGEFYSFEQIKSWHVHFIEKLPEKQFQIPTKRIGRALVFYRWLGYIPKNVWILTSIGAKDRLKRLGLLREIKALGASVVGASFEPGLEDLGDFDLKGIDWAICGGESDDKNPRPMKAEWAENIRRICERDGVPFFFKQRGGKGGDGVGGDKLNGVQYKAFPKWYDLWCSQQFRDGVSLDN